MHARPLAIALVVATAPWLLGSSCGNGSGTGSGGCDGACPQQSLSVAEVQMVIAQAVGEAQANGVTNATIAVVDRVGNALAVFEMPDAATTTTIITTDRGVTTGLENPLVQPVLNALFLNRLAAISKAGTAAYLSSQGNAFSTRTASQIVQENFNPGEIDRAGGPLFGVQFSQLPCGDFVRRLDAGGDMTGPQRMPLGFSADPGGLPLYQQGVPVGGVGVEFDGKYTLDPFILDTDVDLEERVATAAAAGFSAPSERRADRIAVDGRFLRFADDEAVRTNPGDAGPFAGLPGGLVAVPGFYEAPLAVRAGVQFLTPDSGVVASGGLGIDAEVLVDAMGMPLYGPAPSTDPAPAAGGLAANEVMVLLREALEVAAISRAQIRRPTGSSVRVNVSVVDLDGTLLGFARSPDAPVFGADVSLQKARTAAFFSSAGAAAALTAAGFGSTVTATRDLLGDPMALANGLALSDRTVGNLARPFFPDGINGNPNGPLSNPFPQWSPFSTGLQLDAVAAGVLAALAGSTATTCTDPALSAVPNGFQIFPGSVPIYRSGTLIGGIGISGDGVDQDDMVAFLGLHNAGLEPNVNPPPGNAPMGMRADTLVVGNARLRYVSCPPSPFLGSSTQDPCIGK